MFLILLDINKASCLFVYAYVWRKMPVSPSARNNANFTHTKGTRRVFASPYSVKHCRNEHVRLWDCIRHSRTIRDHV